MDVSGQYVLSVAVWNVPGIAIGVVGIILALVRPIRGRTRGLLIGGSATTVFAGIASIAFSLSVPTLLRELDDIDDYERVYLVVGLLFGVLQMVGTGLLIASALVNRASAAPGPPAAYPSGYASGYAPSPEAPPGYAAPGQAPPGYPQPGFGSPGQAPPPGQWGPPGPPGSFG